MAAVRDLYEVLGRRTRRVRRRHQEGLPAARPRAASRRERRGRRRGAVQGGRGRLRDPVRSRQAAALRRLRHRRRAPGRAGSPTSRTSSTCSSVRAAASGRPRRRRGPRSRAQHGEDLGVRIVLGFREAVFGTRDDLEIERLVECERCLGNGAEPGTAPVVVPHVRWRRPGAGGPAQRVRHGDDRGPVRHVPGHRPGGARPVRSVFGRGATDASTPR